MLRIGLVFLLLSTAAAAFSQSATEWGSLPPLPEARFCHGMVAVNGSIYVIGGKSGNTALATVFAYDPLSNQWEQKAPLPSPRACISAGVVGEKIYAFGGDLGTE